MVADAFLENWAVVTQIEPKLKFGLEFWNRTDLKDKSKLIWTKFNLVQFNLDSSFELNRVATKLKPRVKPDLPNQCRFFFPSAMVHGGEDVLFFPLWFMV